MVEKTSKSDIVKNKNTEVVSNSSEEVASDKYIKVESAPELVGFSEFKEEKEVLEPAFRGNFQHSVDEKGRVSFPSDFRKLLAGLNQKSIIITNHVSDGSKCIDGFSVGAWAEFEKKLKTKSRFNSKLQKLENFYLSRAAACSLDSSGRILIPTHLREWADIRKEVTFTSSINGFRIWNRKVWDLVFNKTVEELFAEPGIFDGVDF